MDTGEISSHKQEYNQILLGYTINATLFKEEYGLKRLYTALLITIQLLPKRQKTAD